MPDRPIVAITACTHPRGFEFRDPSVSLSHNYPQVIARLGGVPVVVPNVDTMPESAADCFDALVLTGGGDVDTTLYKEEPEEVDGAAMLVDRLRDDLEIALIRRFVDTGKPILAICRGMQILNVALGGTLYVDLPTELPSDVSHAENDRPREGVHRITIDNASHLFRIAGSTELLVNSTHHQAVRRPGRGLTVTAVADDGTIEGIELPSHPFCVGIQFHPERLYEGEKFVFEELFIELLSASRPLPS